ncbi:Major membrane immunogen, membrane-anchored lipoprotein [Cetobacterium ceti]|uniref:Major membrane immunogen, membrane-anchored lipoprotein n=1 Tax=Cetobacterium ceti TaxID=180163 RepID=A0A1T4K3A3_9FUSO|nr:hypothetical protein [Cetobacterium ceti]SJZ36940.1 Major membrane immunogen, membrane-anchored lipoprotein [Cetobacterium ceti]
MKKILLCSLLLSSIALGAQLKDGKYTVRTDKSIWFWYPYTAMVVKNGEIVSTYHDRIKLDGRKASEDESYNKNMYKKVKINPEMYSKLIPEDFFKNGKDLNKMDGISGATDSLNHFKSQMKFLIEKSETEGPGNYIMKKSEL